MMNELRNSARDSPLSPSRGTTTKISQLHKPVLLLSFAMVTRGEIGFLIASLSLSSRTLTFSSSNMSSPDVVSDGTLGEDLFLVLIWAVVLCTLVGPIVVGVVVKKIRRLVRANEVGGEEMSAVSRSLGVWG